LVIIELGQLALHPIKPRAIKLEQVERDTPIAEGPERVHRWIIRISILEFDTHKLPMKFAKRLLTPARRPVWLSLSLPLLLLLSLSLSLYNCRVV